MKVVRRGEEFVPITITLESEEDADVMWHLLNVGEANSLKDYCRQRSDLRLDLEAMAERKRDAFLALSLVHRPSRDC